MLRAEELPLGKPTELALSVRGGPPLTAHGLFRRARVHRNDTITHVPWRSVGAPRMNPPLIVAVGGLFVRGLVRGWVSWTASCPNVINFGCPSYRQPRSSTSTTKQPRQTKTLPGGARRAAEGSVGMRSSQGRIDARAGLLLDCPRGAKRDGIHPAQRARAVLPPSSETGPANPRTRPLSRQPSYLTSMPLCFFPLRARRGVSRLCSSPRTCASRGSSVCPPDRPKARRVGQASRSTHGRGDRYRRLSGAPPMFAGCLFSFPPVSWCTCMVIEAFSQVLSVPDPIPLPGLRRNTTRR